MEEKEEIGKFVEMLKQMGDMRDEVIGREREKATPQILKEVSHKILEELDSSFHPSLSPRQK